MAWNDDEVVRSFLDGTLSPYQAADLLLEVLAQYSRRDRALILNALRGSSGAALELDEKLSPTDRVRGAVLEKLSALFPERRTTRIAAEELSEYIATPRLDRSRNSGRLIAVVVEGILEYPAFQFIGLENGTKAASVRPTVSLANVALVAGRDPWGALSWWTSRNARTGGVEPVRLLDTPQERSVRLLADAVSEPVG